MIPAVSSQLLLLALTYALLAFLLLVLCLATRWHWSLKAAMVLVVSGFFIFNSQTLRGLSGWPAEDSLPEKFVLLSAVFDEPSPARDHPGNIFIWVNPMKDNQPLEMPRVFRLPYEKDLHRILGDGIQKSPRRQYADGQQQAHSRPARPGLAAACGQRQGGNQTQRSAARAVAGQMMYPPASLRAFPTGGPHQRPGQAGTAVSAGLTHSAPDVALESIAAICRPGARRRMHRNLLTSATAILLSACGASNQGQ